MPGYPIMLCGDHAEFEQEMEGVPPKERPDWPLPSFDARDWAEAFCKKFGVWRRGEPNVNIADEMGLMLSWFANALMRGYDEKTAQMARQEMSSKNKIAQGLEDALEHVKIDREIVDHMTQMGQLIRGHGGKYNIRVDVTIGEATRRFSRSEE